MARDIEALQLQMSADIRKFEKSMQRMAETTERRLNEVERRAARGASNINRNLAQANAARALNFDGARTSASRSLSGIEGDVRRSSSAIRDSLQSVSGVLASAFAAGSVANYADAYTRFTNSLKVAGLEGGRLAGVQEDLYQTAQKYGVQLESLGALYGRTSQGAKELGASQADLERFTEGVAAALKVQGGSEESSRGAILQLTQALGGAIVRAEEFNSINEGARPILQAVANNIDRFGGSVAKLRAEVIEGKVTSREFFQAFLKGADDLEKQAGQTTLTIAASFQVVNNAIGKYVGQTDQSLSATQRSSQAIIELSKHIDVIAPALAGIALVLGGRMVSALAASLVGIVANAIATSRATVSATAYSAALAQNIGMLNAQTTATGRAAAATVGLAGAQRVAGGVAKIAGNAILGAFGGPVGLAITAVTLALTGFAVAGAVADERAKNLALSIDDTTKALERERIAASIAAQEQGKIPASFEKSEIATASLTGEVNKLADAHYRAANAAKAQRLEELKTQAASAQTVANQAKRAAEGDQRARVTSAQTGYASLSGLNASGSRNTGAETRLAREAAARSPLAAQAAQAEANAKALLAQVKAEESKPLANFLPTNPTVVDPKAAKAAAAAAAQAQREADRVAKDALRDDRRFQDELFAAGDALLRAQQQRAMTAREALELELRAIGRDEEARKIDIERDLADKNITEAEKAKLIEADKAVFAERRANAQREGEANIRAERMQAEEQYLDLTLQLLQLQGDAAKTAAERRKVELEALRLTQQRARDELDERIRQDKDRVGGPTFDHQQARDALARVQSAQSDAVKRSTMGPLARWQDEANKTAGEMRESVERVAADGLDNLNEGLVDIITGTKDAGEAFKDMANGIIADLARIALQKYVTGKLGNALFGSEDSSGNRSGGFFDGLFGGKKAFGGSAQKGKIYQWNERGKELFMPNVNGQVIDAATVRRLMAAPKIASNQPAAPTIYAPLMQISAGSDVVSASWVAGLNAKIAAVQKSAVAESLRQTRKSIGGMQASYGKLGT